MQFTRCRSDTSATCRQQTQDRDFDLIRCRSSSYPQSSLSPSSVRSSLSGNTPYADEVNTLHQILDGRASERSDSASSASRGLRHAQKKDDIRVLESMAAALPDAAEVKRRWRQLQIENQQALLRAQRPSLISRLLRSGRCALDVLHAKRRN